MSETRAAEAFAELVRIVQELRTPETGCPWDLEQDHRSLRPYLIEEAYEVLQAIDAGVDTELCDELGDLLLQVVLHAQVAKDRHGFEITDIVQSISKKMVRRHPHVFGDTKLGTSDQVLKNWEKIKQTEKGGSAADSGFASRLEAIPAELPALLRVQRIGEKAAKANFDWDGIAGVMAKVHEEFAELEAEILQIPEQLREAGSHPLAANALSEPLKLRLEHELGDVLFSICQLARWLGISAEDSLRAGATRFLSRFKMLEGLAAQPLSELSEQELDALWEQAKKKAEKHSAAKISTKLPNN
ncbi:MAG: nucleoside triphosphate pyrophosphohydrolase [Bdellovibrionales bacterium]|nr:nucleoside triphosphate pyrophosphohydrolase [Bdellovibrionales bacterium]